MSLKILDCTIRDGGHICNWEFDELCVKASYFAAIRSGISYFEIGYRNPQTIKGLGKFGYCEDDFLLKLIQPTDECKLTIMVDAGKATTELFKQCDPNTTPVRAVRVAAYPYEIEKAIYLIEDFKSKGYEVFLNLMACSELSDEDYHKLEKWNNKTILESINFADSFGSFVTKDITYYIQKLNSIGYAQVGFHSHNNLQMAFANTLRAIEDDVSFVDASIFGMGRGAGNLPIEVLLSYMEKNNVPRYNVAPYLDVIDRFYLDLHNKYKWGYRLPSLMSGIKNIHPYYVRSLFENEVFTVNEIWNVLDTIKEKCPVSYSKEQLDKALDKRFYTSLSQEKVNNIYEEIKNELKIIRSDDAFHLDEFEYKDKYCGRKFLIIANGKSIGKYKESIQEFIEDNKCITIGVNNINNLFVPDYHMYISRKRFLNHLSAINKKSMLLIPSFWGHEIIDQNYSGKHSFFEIECLDHSSDVTVEGIVQKCPNLNVTISAILTAYQMGAKEIYAVGMDGYIEETEDNVFTFYNEDDHIEDREVSMVKYKEFSEEIDKLNMFLQSNSVNFSIITPTSHKRYFKSILNI